MGKQNRYHHKMYSRNEKYELDPLLEEKSYDKVDDITNKIPDFHLNRNPGNHVPVGQQTRTTFTKAIDFYKLFFTIDVDNCIVCHTNPYAWKIIINKKSYANRQGTWIETNNKEVMNFIVLLIYQRLVKANTFTRYWSRKSLYHGLWSRKFMSRDRIKSMLTVLHAVDPFF